MEQRGWHEIDEPNRIDFKALESQGINRERGRELQQKHGEQLRCSRAGGGQVGRAKEVRRVRVAERADSILRRYEGIQGIEGCSEPQERINISVA